jgi:hypothetical protein
MKIPDWQQIDVRWLGVAGSILVSFYVLLLPEIPNDDAYVYLRTAQLYLDEGFGAALAHYSWPAYSILTAELSRLGVPLLTAALLINVAFYALLVYSFIAIVQLLDDSRRLALLAAATILLYPELNEFRTMVLRDVGYWALSLFAIWQLLRYAREQQLAQAVAFTAAMLLATAFRLEAVVYLALLPLALLWQARNSAAQQHWAAFYRLTGLVYGLLLGGLILLALSGSNLLALAGQVLSTYRPFLDSLISPDPVATAELGRLLFGEHAAAFSNEYLSVVIMTGLLAILVMTLIYGISGAYFWLLVYGAWQRYWATDRQGTAVLATYALINALILICFLYLTRFLTSRYAIPLGLMAATQVPFVVNRILLALQGKPRQTLVRNLLVLFFVFCFFDAYVSFGRSKAYLDDAVDYVNVHASPQQALVTNNHTIAFTSGRVTAYDEVPRLLPASAITEARPGDYFALEMITEVRQLVRRDDLAPLLEFVTAFPTEREQRVAIYRRVNP